MIKLRAAFAQAIAGMAQRESRNSLMRRRLIGIIQRAISISQPTPNLNKTLTKPFFVNVIVI
jgi:hypothetical protein